MTKQELLDLRAEAEGWSNSDTWQVHTFACEVIDLIDELLADKGDEA